jgi:hypothetical protein
MCGGLGTFQLSQWAAYRAWDFVENAPHFSVTFSETCFLQGAEFWAPCRLFVAPFFWCALSSCYELLQGPHTLQVRCLRHLSFQLVLASRLLGAYASPHALPTCGVCPGLWGAPAATCDSWVA